MPISSHPVRRPTALRGLFIETGSISEIGPIDPDLCAIRIHLQPMLDEIDRLTRQLTAEDQIGNGMI